MKRDAATETTPTTELWATYQAMFSHFNAALWAGQLPDCILNLSRWRGALGVFIPGLWADQSAVKRSSQGGRCRRGATIPAAHWPGVPQLNEISLNPDHSTRSPLEIASTLVHEMAHHWQQENGKPGRGGYHNVQWGTEMKRVGLQPVSFDRPGTGTGCKVSHSIIPDGAFLKAFAELPAQAMPWAQGQQRVTQLGPDGKPLPPVAPGSGRVGGPARNKRTYLCGCGNKVWGKPGLAVTCDECEQAFVEQ